MSDDVQDVTTDETEAVEAAADDTVTAEAEAPADEETQVEEPVAEVEAADEPVTEEPPAEESVVEEPAVEEAPVEEPVAEVEAAEEAVAEEEAPGAVSEAFGPVRVARVYVCERGHRTTTLWGTPEVCQARPLRSGPVCGLPLYHITELPDQVQKALNPLKASKKASKKK